MATSAAPPAAVPEAFHYETKYVVLSYLQLQRGSRSQTLADPQGDAQVERERATVVLEQIEDELRQLEDDMQAAHSRSGFDRHASLVFRPSTPESSIEDCLAVIGDGVAKQLDAYLAAAVDKLLSEPLAFEGFRDAASELSTHTQEGWNAVLVPLVLLQVLQSKGQSVTALLNLGLRYFEEDKSDFIIQQGGWGEVFGLVSEEERGVTIAEDSNDIYILSGEQHPDQLSPPSSLLCTGDDGSEQSSWQTESLPVSLAGHESWAQVAAMDPEDIKSLDSNEGVALAEERSENNSSNSDIVHVEREEAELLEEGGGANEESMMSVLGTESELAELREGFRDHTPPVPDRELDASTPPTSLILLEEPVGVESPLSVSAEASLVSSEPELLPAASDLELAAPLSGPEPEPAPKPAATSDQVPAETPSQPLTEEPTAPAVVEATLEPEEDEATLEPAEDQATLEPAEDQATLEPAEDQATLEPAEDQATLEPAEDQATLEPAAEVEEEPVVVPQQAEESKSGPEAEADPVFPSLVSAAAEASVEPPADPPKEVPVEATVEAAEEVPVQTEWVLLYGGTALVALLAVVYGLMHYRR